jgi:hypothetical protein
LFLSLFFFLFTPTKKTLKTQYPHAPKSRPNFCPFKVTLWAIGESGGAQVAESQLLAGCPCRWKDGTEKKEVIDNQQDMPQRDLEAKMRQKGKCPKCNHLGIIYLQKPVQRNIGQYIK